MTPSPSDEQETSHVAFCGSCGRDIHADEHAHDLRGFAICPACIQQSARPGIPWEEETQGSWLESLAHTVWLALRYPSEFFELARAGRPALPALLFGVTLSAFGATLQFVWFFLFEPNADTLLRAGSPMQVPIAWLRAYALLASLISGPIICLAYGLLLRVTLIFAQVPHHAPALARVVGFSMAAYVWMLLPPIAGFPLGAALTVGWMFHLSTHGLRRFIPSASPLRLTLVVTGAMMMFILFLL